MRNRKLSKKSKLAIVTRMRELLAASYAFTKGRLKRKEKRAPTGYAYCLLGAAEVAYRELFPNDMGNNNGHNLAYCVPKKYGSVMDQIGITESIKDRGMDSIVNFNDNPETTKKDVITLLDEKIAELS